MGDRKLKKLIRASHTRTRPEVWVEVDLENRYIETDARDGRDFYYALKQLWCEDDELIKWQFPLDIQNKDRQWTYKFVNGFPFGEIH